jgi:hypothetical protein
MNLYRQSILLFGVIIPLVLMIAVVGIGHVLRTKMVESHDIKQKTFTSNKKSEIACLNLEKENQVLRDHLARWSEQMSKETAGVVASNLSEITEGLPNKEILRTAFERPSGKTTFGSVSAQNSSNIRIGYRGTFRTLQKAFLQLETRMPQLLLEEFKLEPVGTSSSMLNFQVTYTAWEK